MINNRADVFPLWLIDGHSEKKTKKLTEELEDNTNISQFYVKGDQQTGGSIS